MRFIVTGSVFIILLSIVVCPGTLDAAWPPNGLLVCGEANDQEAVRIVSDGAGGAIVAWEDRRDPDRRIYAQRVDGSANPYWTPGGIQVSGTGNYRLLEMVTDGENGAILVWFAGSDVYAQRIDDTGAVQWSSAGVHVLGSGADQLVAVADGAGGVIMAYRYAATGDDIYAQKLNSAGTLMWDDPPGHVAVSTAGSDENEPRIVADGSGGAIIVFLSGRSGYSNYELYAQRVFSSGAVWFANGVAVSTGDFGRGDHAVTCDGAGNAIIAWREGLGEFDILARRIDAGGTLQWTGAVWVCSATDNQETPDILADGSGGAYIVWADHREAQNDVFAQRVDVMGNVLWTADGVPVCFDFDNQSNPRLLPCESGCIAVWEDRRGDQAIFGQKIDIGGGHVWTLNGVEVIRGEVDFGDYDFDADGAGGILVAITDDREAAGLDIYAQSINCFGSVASPEPAITGIEDVPGDQGGNLRITIARSDRDDNGQELEQVDHYDIWQRVDSLAALSVVASSGAADASGIMSCQSGGSGNAVIFESCGGRYLLTAPTAVEPEGTWEFVGSFDATQSDEYTYRTTTLADSSASGIPYSVYVVSAHTINPAVWFVSEPDSGYSVDNIAPGVPEGFTVAYNTGSGNQLTWDPAPEPDFQYYRIYRGDNEDFVPGPGNLVHETATEGWSDPEYDGWDVHYKITALDYAGNESDAASPESVTGDDVPSAPTAFALYQNVPNPFNPTTTISFDLPRAEHVKLSVYNVRGELVSTIVDQHVTEGRKEVIWSATDVRGRSVASGIYFYRLVAGDFVQTKKMVLLK